MIANAALLESYCQAYAKGIVQFLLSGEPQTVFFDPDERRFGTEMLAAGTSPTDVTIWIADGWRNLAGPTIATCDPTSGDFKPDVLEQELSTQLKTSVGAIEHYKEVLKPHFNA